MAKKQHNQGSIEQELIKFAAFAIVTLLVTTLQERGLNTAEAWYQRRKQAKNRDYVDYEEVK